MFDLSKEISNWRTKLSQKQTCIDTDLDELESHLKDEMDQLEKKDLSQQEAFLVAAHRLGDTDALADEFAKVNKSLLLRKKLFYAVCGIFAFMSATYVATAFSKISLLLATLHGYRGYTAATIEMVSKSAVFVLMILLWYIVTIKMDPDGRRFSKTADTRKGKLVLLMMAFLLIVVHMSAIYVPPAVIVRTLGAQEYRQIIMPAMFMQIGWMFMPVVIMALVIYLRPAKRVKTA
ncbi:MAG: hypothetical protein FVQ79_03935 [Planctomycetes bacterium]|nr:hypothetical protein [Planctomycetota bacterium]